jgi:hypothetical protein
MNGGIPQAKVQPNIFLRTQNSQNLPIILSFSVMDDLSVSVKWGNVNKLRDEPKTEKRAECKLPLYGLSKDYASI